MTILIDQDNTMADFIGGFQKQWKVRYPNVPAVPLAQYKSHKIAEQYPPELKKQIIDIYTRPGFILNLEPIAGSVEAIKAMAVDGHDVWICTSPLTAYQNCVLEKYQWIEKYLGKDFTKKVVFSKDKTLIRGDFLIDDSPQRKGIFAPTWRQFIFDQPYNRNISGPRILGWDEWRGILIEF